MTDWYQEFVKVSDLYLQTVAERDSARCERCCTRWWSACCPTSRSGER
jgi:hypothetical protein